MKYRALVLDLDGTLVDDSGVIRPRTMQSLRQAVERGVRVMVATGRSELGALPVLRELGLDTPAVVFNGAGIYCPVEERLLRHSVLSDHVVEHTFEYAIREDLMMMVAGVGKKFVSHPRNRNERMAVELLEALEYRGRDELPRDELVRVSVFSDRHGDADGFYEHFSNGLAD